MSAALAAGFASPVHDAQAVFRCVMMAMARPGTVRRIAVPLDPPGCMQPAAAAAALALCDFETPVWLDEALSSHPHVREWLRFHTGAPVVAASRAAAFAFVADGRALPAFSTFALGTLDYPDRSVTAVVAVDALHEGMGWRLTGPGIPGETRFIAEGLPADMLDRLAGNRGLFPRGIDIVLVCGDRIAALPRTTIVEA
ncbi:phosphonate C-P lyase system protein PhnH [uncultured Alsobacter sp.]|uniref:phosphonate C-P lyase system protein PhnH n=1 Tax=uncultured Alsobacter sp. TaxID=1748258 RepID=UPI0025F0152F|nr:phosphonate C-P lyase system protein PhnH [uncultured Alsobacter sp.]